jgi:hypothetical protein
MSLSYAGVEKAGLDMIWVAEAYGFDAVSLMGYLAAKTETHRDRVGHPADLHPHPHAAGHDRGRARRGVRTVAAMLGLGASGRR